MKTHKVKAGDCIHSLSAQHRLLPDAIWSLPENEKLRELGRTPNMLVAGDTVSLPDKRPFQKDIELGGRHSFVLKRQRVELRVRLLAGEDPIANEPYTVRIGSETVEGQTDADGLLVHTIVSAATNATLELYDGEVCCQLALGTLQPPDTPNGAAQRLANLGLAEPGLDELGLRAAVEMFQLVEDLPNTGNLDAATIDRLRSRHGC